jgi:hypothetical protein
MPAPTGVGTLPDGSLTWVDAQGNQVNPDGSPVANAQPVRPLAPAANTVGQTQPPLNATAPTTTNYPPPVTIPTATTATATPAPGTPGATTVGPPQVQGPNPAGPAGQYTVQQILAPFDTEFGNANKAVLDLNDTINGRHGAKDDQGNPLPDITGDAETLQTLTAQAVPGVVDPALQTAQAKYQADMNAYSTAQQRLYAANIARQQALQKALDQNQLVPSQVNLATQQANESAQRAGQIQSQVAIAAQLAPSQQALLVSQSAQAAAQAQLDAANATKATATTPADIQLATAQASQAQAQADSINAMVDVNKQKVQADTTLTQHQVGLTDSQSANYLADAAEAQARGKLETAQADLTQAQVAGAPAEQAARTAQAAGAGAQAQATAQQIQENILKGQQGPAYHLTDQLNALGPIVQQVFHNPANAGKSVDELNGMADDLLKQYVAATLGGTTVGQAAAATATAQQNNYATQMGGVNALQAAMANRANAYAAAQGNVLGTIAQMNQWAPRGSTAGAGAFNEVMNQLANRMSTQFGPTQLPQAPPLPTFLQAFAAGHQAGQQQAQGPGGTQAPTVNVNVNGQPAAGATVNPGGLPVGLNQPGGAAPTTTPQQAFNQGMQASGYQPGAIPVFAQNYMGFANPMQMIGFRGY